jgi:glycogen(starch) synthase
MRVLMLGWEFPPFISGGLGTACHGLTKAMSELGIEVLFVLPKPVASEFSSHVRLMAPRSDVPGSMQYQLSEFDRVTFRTVDTVLSPYQTPADYAQAIAKQRGVRGHAGAPSPSSDPSQPTAVLGGLGGGGGEHYAGDLIQEVHRYAGLAMQIASVERFDVIHAHDWMTYPAGIAAAALTGKPLVVHIHSTEFDRSGEHVNQRVYDIERAGMHHATRVIAVSHLTKKLVESRYSVPAEKVEVVYNAVEWNNNHRKIEYRNIARDEKIVLFLGRITMQKGPEYFLAAAKKVLEKVENVRFIMAGSGDMIRRTIELAAEMGIGHRVLFTGFLRGDDVDRVYRMADLYVMPSVSEPFGIAPLEAISRDVPAIISKQSGVSEILTHVLKVDFWDIDEMANKIVAVLKHPPLQSTLREHGSFELRKLNWSDSARRCLEIYQRVTAGA